MWIRWAAQCIGLIALVAFQPTAWAQTSQAIQWDLSSAYAESMFITQNLQQFAQEVRETTNHQLNITVHPSGKLYKGLQIKEATQTGKTQAGEIIMSSLAGEIPVMGIDSMPFLTSNYTDAKLLWQVSKARVEQELEKRGLKLLYVAPWPPQGLYSSKALLAANDLRGLKMRTYNPATKQMASMLGAVGTEVAVVDLPKALAKGDIDAFFSSAATGVDVQAWKHLKQFYDVRAWIPKNIVFANKNAYDALSPLIQTKLLAAAAKAQERAWLQSEKKAQDLNATLAANGMTVVAPSPFLLKDFDRLGEKLAKDWLKQLDKRDYTVVIDFLTKRYSSTSQ